MQASIDLGDEDAWDDGALLRSWNTAVEEYKKYHSIAVRGENVEDVLKQEELKGEGGVLESSKSQVKAATGVAEGASITPMNDSEELPFEPEFDVAEQQSFHETTEKAPGAPSTNATAASTATPMPPPMAAGFMPQMLLSGQDEAMKNLMMSWYYAGYYTGLYEGQQKAAQEMQESKPK
ncbi:uncharacterized protein K452DRAFT_358213 [Aplosporella prunicola CBS 121167]|uniref:Uncharacterized protein n=1 Tax=Aplosporella prunicola CBS 121167 TaxID=1176127 RepID=A0A6A6BFS3_9PEZI|nr:uncharacterized protein K452DRAFT_358213 [Aplosporella prunicola CBS 121167]KAF2142418.1 hypothetical protein K452DRAFT_358213 [Aplosporella prunicola CBS 121167]